jgi:cobalamin biosynthesis Mg chelatase CobN
LTVDNVNYTILDLPVVFWWAEDSNHTFAYSSPLVIESSGKQYVWVNATGLSTLQSGFVIASETGSITANYKTEYIYGLPLWVWVLIVVLIVVVVAVGVVYFRRRKS